jgi:hypothetical protein
LSVIASAMTAPDAILKSLDRKLPLALAIIGLGRTLDDVGKAGARPPHLQQQIVRAAHRQQPALDGLPAMLDAGCGAQALRGNRAYCRQRILDAVVQFFHNQLLQSVGGLALLGIDTGLRKQGLGIDTRLFEQHAKADIFGLEKILRSGRAGHRLHSPEGPPLRGYRSLISPLMAGKYGYFRYRTSDQGRQMSICAFE